MAFSEDIYKTYHQDLLNFVRRRVRDADIAKDIVQEVFSKVHAKLYTLSHTERLPSWLYQITRNAIIDYYRTHKQGEELPEDLAEDKDPDGGVLSELEACLQPMIQNLPQTYREAIQLSELEGLPLKQVAERQGVSLSGAKSRVQRGRAKLKEMLFACCEFELNHHGQMVEYRPKDGNGCDNC